MTAYDEIPYDCGAFPQAHPGRLCLLGRLYGLAPAPLATARVLELGCGDGTHLLPFAAAHPDARCLGIDLAVRQVEDGLARVRALGVANLELRAADIAALDPATLGTFDYVIAHGVYSWVPAAVREAIAALVGTVLAPEGIAFLSYTALPGGWLRLASRQLMRYHVRHLDGPEARGRQARAALAWVAANQVAGDWWRQLLDAQHDRIAGFPDALLFHDDLSDAYGAFALADVMDVMRPHGLRFLTEANWHESAEAMLRTTYPPELAARLRELGDDVEAVEQYSDFLRARVFRQTLLCRADRPRRPAADPDAMRGLHFASPATADGPVSLEPGTVVTFRRPPAAVIDAPSPAPKVVLRDLRARWPATRSFDELLAAVRDVMTPAERPVADEALAELLLTLCATCLVDAFAEPVRVASAAGERPAVTPVARAMAAVGGQVINERHERIRLESGLERALLVLCDGTRDRAALLAALPADPGTGDRPDAEALERSLGLLQRQALLAP